MGVEDLIDSVAANLGNIQVVDWLRVELEFWKLTTSMWVN